jgi:hypothetical protein
MAGLVNKNMSHAALFRDFITRMHNPFPMMLLRFEVLPQVLGRKPVECAACYFAWTLLTAVLRAKGTNFEGKLTGGTLSYISMM